MILRSGQLRVLKMFFSDKECELCYSFQLALSPSPRLPSESVTVTLDTQFVLKVEGLIEHGQNPGKVVSQCVLLKRLKRTNSYSWL